MRVLPSSKVAGQHVVEEWFCMELVKNAETEPAEQKGRAGPGRAGPDRAGRRQQAAGRVQAAGRQKEVLSEPEKTEKEVPSEPDKEDLSDPAAIGYCRAL